MTRSIAGVLLVLLAGSCGDEPPPACLTKNAVRDSHSVCGCPDGTRTVARACVPDTAADGGVDVAANNGGADGQVVKPADRGRVDAGTEGDQGSEPDDVDAFEDDSEEGRNEDAGISAQPPSAELDDSGSAMTPACIPSTEICDGLDNDCDALIDEDVTRPCGSTAGACKQGVLSCRDGKWDDESACKGAIGPAPEVCDSESRDEDCDGIANEGCACTNGETKPCGDKTAPCKQGTLTCVDGVWPTICVGEVKPTVETCDGIDNDCDGSVDEGVKNACGGCAVLPHPKGARCRDGAGDCAATGTYECSADNESTTCSATAKSPSTWYRDCDSDGFGTLTGSVKQCSSPTDGTCTWTLSASPPDCDDTSAAKYPGAKPQVSSADPISPLRLATYIGDMNCDGKVEKVSVDFSAFGSTTVTQHVDLVPCTSSNWCAGGKGCYSILDKPEGSMLGCGNTEVTVAIGGGSAACLTEDGVIRVICQ